MIIHILTNVSREPVVMHATQVVVFNNQGTPISAAAEYGPEGAQKVVRVGDSDFERFLKALGVGGDVRVDVVRDDVPSGARLLPDTGQTTKGQL